MKEYKLNVYNTLCEKAGVCRKINFYDVCKSIGVMKSLRNFSVSFPLFMPSVFLPKAIFPKRRATSQVLSSQIASMKMPLTRKKFITQF